MILNEEQQLELSRIAHSRSLCAGYVFRARLILMLAEGASFSTIEQRLRTTAPTIIRPENWGGRWYETDDVYLAYQGDGYYLFNRRYPGPLGIAVSVSL